MKTIPQLASFPLSISEIYDYSNNNLLNRIGLKVNTPSICNWACPYCYASDAESTERPKKVFESRNGIEPYNDPNWNIYAKNWINQSISMGVKSITINGTFEPTMSPFLIDIIRYAVDRHLFVTLVTNGTKLTQEMIRILYDLGICILTKLNVPIVELNDQNYALYASIQKQLSGRKEPSEQIYERQKSLVQELVNAGFNNSTKNGTTRLGVETVITSTNIDYIPQLVRQLRALNIYSHVEVMKVQGFAEHNSSLSVSKKQILTLFNSILNNDKNDDYELWEIKPPYVAGTCYQNLLRLDIHANGDINPCPGIPILLGNLHASSLDCILNHEDLKTIRNLRDHVQGDCKRCELFDQRLCYAGCRGTAFQTLQKLGYSKYDCLTASDPSCHRVRKVLDDSIVLSDIFK